MGKKISQLVWLSLPLLIIGIYYIPTLFQLCLAIILVKILFMDKDSLGIFLLLYGGALAGITRTIYPFVPVYGLLFNFIGLILLRKWVYSLFKKSFVSIFYMSIVIVLFGISYLMGDRSLFATNKMIGILLHGLLLLPAYYVISSSYNINNHDLYQLLTITSISYIGFVMLNYKISPSNIFDFNWFRQAIESYCYINKEDVLIGYQDVGMTSLYGFTFWLCHKDFYSNKKLFFYVFVISIFIIMISGARQSIVGFFIVVFLRFAIFNSSRPNIRILNILLPIIFCLSLYEIIISLNVSSVTSVNESGIGDRNLIFQESIRIFNENPLFGVGLGNFAFHTNLPFAWPHNMILEILCESGIVCFSLLFFLVVGFWNKNQDSIFYISSNGTMYYLLVVALFIRVMVSSHLAESIEIFCAIFAVSKTSKSFKLNLSE